MMDEHRAVEALGALAQGMRLRIFRALVGAGPQGLTPGVLSATLDTPGSTLAFHLKELMRAGLVSQQRDGRHLIYRPALAQMTALLDYLTAHCCQTSDGPDGPDGPAGADCSIRRATDRFACTRALPPSLDPSRCQDLP